MNNNYVIAITRACGSGATSISRIWEKDWVLMYMTEIF